MKVLLINPPAPDKKNWVREGRCQQWDIWGAPFPPLSLASIAGQIKSLTETLIIDSGASGLDLEKTLKKIDEYDPELIILSTTTPTITTDLGWFLAKVKRLKPSLKAAAIGIHVTELPKETLQQFSYLDFIIRAEPELTVKDLVNHLKENRFDFKNIPGLAFRNGKRIIINQPRELLMDLDKLEFPYWQGVDFNNYKLPILNKPFNLISFTRGCPFNCKFCNASVYYGKKIRKRSPEKIIEEIEINIKDYKIRDFLFWTESLTMDKEYLRNVLNFIKKKGLNKKIRWIGNSRAEELDSAFLKELKEAGCWQVAFGLEFGSNRILKLADKGLDVSIEKGRKAVAAAVKQGIVADGHFILGYPGETEKTLQETISFAVSLPLTFAHFYTATPFPGSRLYEEVKEKNWIFNQNWENINQDTPNLQTPWLNPETVKKYISLAYKRFYFRPTTIWRIIKLAKSPSQFFNILKLGIKFSRDILKSKTVKTAKKTNLLI